MKRTSLAQKLLFITTRGILKQVDPQEYEQQIEADFNNINCSYYQDHKVLAQLKQEKADFVTRGLTLWQYSTNDRDFIFTSITQWTKHPKTFIELIYWNYERNQKI